MHPIPMTLACLALLFAVQAAAPDTVVITPAEAVIEVGEMQQFTARAYDASGAETEGAVAQWFVQDEHVLTIDEDGLATAHRPGTAQVVAVIEGKPAYASVLVPQLPPASITAELPVMAVLAGTTVPLTVAVRSRLNERLPNAPLRYDTGNRRVATVDEDGRVTGVAPGQAMITVKAGRATAQIRVTVTENTATSYQIAQNRVSIRRGDVVRMRVIAEDDNGDRIAGVHPTWMVTALAATIHEDGPDGLFVAEEAGVYTITAIIGPEIARSITVDVGPRRYNARLVSVGRGAITNHHSGDTWAFEGVDGRDYAYVGTFLYDWMKAIDVTDPANPVLTDSVQVDARRINDVKIHPNNRIGVITREGASDRKNGMVLLDLSTPAHPTILSEYTDTVTGGVHNVWIDGEHDLVYACHNGTNALHIIDISDPRNPKEVGRWGLDKRRKTLHDVIVQEGYAYLSYWDDGIVTLDVGAGTHGGTPVEPAFVSRYSYPEGNTHVAWRYGKYLFVGDEIWPDGWDVDARIDARGYIHVLDMTDMDSPVEVARYEVPEAGAHNIWAEMDRLYVGYYQGGLRVLDISGELRGDLLRQGREMAVLRTTDSQTMIPDWPMTWGAQIFKGHIFTSDLNSGLWIARLIEHAPVP